MGLPWDFQWLRHHASSAWGTGSIPGWETKILHAMQHGQKLGGKKWLICNFQTLFFVPFLDTQERKPVLASIEVCICRDSTFPEKNLYVTWEVDKTGNLETRLHGNTATQKSETWP